MTISPWPSRVTSPARIIGAGWTLATSAIVTGTPFALVDDDRRDVLDAVRLALAADVAGLALVDEVAAADVGVVASAGRRRRRSSTSWYVAELVGVELDLVRLQLAAVRVDLGHARDLAELVGDEPVEDRPQLHRRDARLLGRP